MNNDLARGFLLVKTFIPVRVLLSFWPRIAFPISPTVVCECEMLVIKLRSHGVYWVAPGSAQKSLELGLGVGSFRVALCSQHPLS